MVAGKLDPGLSLTQVLGRYVAETEWADIPAEVREKARLCILDGLGCMIAGASTSVGRTVGGLAETKARAGTCTVVGNTSHADLEAATLANVARGHVLELDDGHRPSDNHLGSAVVGTALAAAEHCDASGAALVRSVVLGYDVMGRVGEAVCRPRRPRPVYHHTSTTAGIGAAATCSVLFGLSADQAANALSIATVGAAGLREVFVTGVDCKSLQVGRSARSGVEAALLAAAGIEGPLGAIEGEYGFIRGLGGPAPEPERITSDLGSRFAVSESTFKVHSACGMLFTPVDAALALRMDRKFGPADIDVIRVALPYSVKGDPVYARRRPQTAAAARYSVPFGVAAAMKDGEVTPRQMSTAGISDPVIAEFESKIEMVFDDPEVNALFDRTKGDDFFFNPAAVTVVSGENQRRHLAATPNGYDPAKALTETQVREKFLRVTRDAVGDRVNVQLAEEILRLGNEGGKSAREVTRALRLGYIVTE